MFPSAEVGLALYNGDGLTYALDIGYGEVAQNPWHDETCKLILDIRQARSGKAILKFFKSGDSSLLPWPHK